MSKIKKEEGLSAHHRVVAGKQGGQPETGRIPLCHRGRQGRFLPSVKRPSFYFSEYSSRIFVMRVGFPTTDCTSRLDSPLSSYTNLLRKIGHDIFYFFKTIPENISNWKNQRRCDFQGSWMWCNQKSTRDQLKCLIGYARSGSQDGKVDWPPYTSRHSKYIYSNN